MKTKSTILVLVVFLFTAGATSHAQSEPTQGPASLGVLLDSTPLCDLLVKHLGLSPDQGVRVRNIHREGPADKAGLERDDIIIGFQGKDVTDLEEFVSAVRDSGVGTEVSLEIIHLGRRKTVNLKLEPFPSVPDWKYPPEPRVVQSWRPGKMFRLRPGDKGWMEIPFDNLLDNLPNIDIDFSRIFNQLYYYHHSDGTESYTIIIEGDPDNDDTQITVQAGNTEYKTTVKDIDQLPGKYRDIVKEDLENARKSFKNKYSRPFLEYFHDKKHFPFGSEEPWYGPGRQMYDRIEKQMRQLQERIEALEKNTKELLDRLSDKLKEKKSQYLEKQGRQEEEYTEI